MFKFIGEMIVVVIEFIILIAIIATVVSIMK